MAVIEREKSLRFENLLSLRRKMTQEDINNEFISIWKIMNEKGAQKNGPIITSTFNIETINGQPVFDMEILIPLDKKIDLPDGYKFKELFHLMHALYLRFEGNLSGLGKAYQELHEYIRTNNLYQITAGYNVAIKDPKSDGMGGMNNDVIIDIYMGINPSVV